MVITSSTAQLLVDTSITTIPSTTTSISFLSNLELVTTLTINLENNKAQTEISNSQANFLVGSKSNSVSSMSSSIESSTSTSKSEANLITSNSKNKVTWALTSFILCSVVVGSL